MKNPKINRIIGYIIMFIGFYFVYKGAGTGTTDSIKIGIGIGLVIGSVIWSILKVRCPHCNGLLSLKLNNIDVCPHCGSNTNI